MKAGFTARNEAEAPYNSALDLEIQDQGKRHMSKNIFLLIIVFFVLPPIATDAQDLRSIKCTPKHSLSCSGSIRTEGIMGNRVGLESLMYTGREAHALGAISWQYRCFVKFDIKDIPKNATIKAATLTVYCTNPSQGNENFVEVRGLQVDPERFTTPNGTQDYDLIIQTFEDISHGPIYSTDWNATKNRGWASCRLNSKAIESLQSAREQGWISVGLLLKNENRPYVTFAGAASRFFPYLYVAYEEKIALRETPKYSVPQIVEISISPNPPEKGESISLTVKLQNQSQTLFSMDSLKLKVDIDGKLVAWQEIHSLPPSQVTQINISEKSPLSTFVVKTELLKLDMDPNQTLRNILHSRSVTIEPIESQKQISLPDLVIESITLEPPEPVADQKAMMRVRVRNIGSAGTNKFFYGKLYDNGQPRSSWSVEALGIGESKMLVDDMTFSQGHHIIQIKINEDDLIQESSTTNNISTIEFQAGERLKSESLDYRGSTYKITTLVSEITFLYDELNNKSEKDLPGGIAIDANGDVYYSTLTGQVVRVTNEGNSYKILKHNYQLGDNVWPRGYVAFLPGLTLDKEGNIYVADSENSRILRVNNNNIITTIAGLQSFKDPAPMTPSLYNSGFSGDGGLATSARLKYPVDVALDNVGDLYIADELNNRIRRVTQEGIITTVAGTGLMGFSGDGGLGTMANLNKPCGLAVDNEGNLFIADTYNHRIRKLTPDGIIKTVAGRETSGFSGDGGPATLAELDSPVGIAIDEVGTLYIADTKNHRIRKLTPDGIIHTIAGNGSSGTGGDGDVAISAQLESPGKIAIDQFGNVYVSDFGGQIRKLIPQRSQ